MMMILEPGASTRVFSRDWTLKRPSPRPEHDTSKALPLSPLYPILDASFPLAWPAGPAMEALAEAGCRLIQLRAKELTSGTFHEWALEGVERAQSLGARVVINDRLDIALTTGAAGVHLGQDDLSPRSARRILGPDAIIGFSTHSIDQAAEADGLPVDYVAVGPVYATSTKQTEAGPLGPQGVAQIRKVVHKPLVAIGGINLDNGAAVMESGADSLAVISALMAEPDLKSAARKWMEKLLRQPF